MTADDDTYLCVTFNQVDDLNLPPLKDFLDLGPWDSNVSV